MQARLLRPWAHNEFQTPCFVPGRPIQSVSQEYIYCLGFGLVEPEMVDSFPTAISICVTQSMYLPPIFKVSIALFLLPSNLVVCRRVAWR